MKGTKKLFIFAALMLALVSISSSSCRRCGGCPTWEIDQQK